MDVHAVGAFSRAKWDFMPEESETELSDKGGRLMTLFAKFSKMWDGQRPPFVPQIEDQTWETFHASIVNNRSKTYLDKLQKQWRQGKL